VIKYNRMRWVGHVAAIRKMRREDKVLSEGNRPLEIYRRTWNNNKVVQLSRKGGGGANYPESLFRELTSVSNVNR
jgi:hypothetical protein